MVKPADCSAGFALAQVKKLLVGLDLGLRSMEKENTGRRISRDVFIF